MEIDTTLTYKHPQLSINLIVAPQAHQPHVKCFVFV